MNKYISISEDSPLILASKSPRRKNLLKQVGIPFRSLPSNIEENAICGLPSHMAERLAGEKASAALKKIQGSWILGVDTIVVLGDRILGKPTNADNAREMLKILSGKDHEVITGYSVLNPSCQRSFKSIPISVVKSIPLYPLF